MADDCNEIWGTDYDRVIIENGITSIGKRAFAYSNIESIEIAGSVSFIDEYAFSNCTRLTSIQIPYGVQVLSWGLFEDCTSLSNVILPNTITETEYEVFCGCTSLKHITLPDSLRIIQHGVFMDSGLESIIIPQNCETIQVAAFSGCTNLASVELKEGVKNLLNGCFSDCIRLSNIEIPSTVTNIGEAVFEGDEGLESILFKGNAPALSEKAFNGITATVYYPDNDDSWTDVVDLNYGGDITWIPGNPNGGTDFAPVEPANITSTFNFRSGLKNDNSIEYTFNYNDNWVFSENSNNRYKLMQTSIRVAMAAFGTKEDRDYGERNIKKMMSRMGFKYTNDSIDYPNPQEDTIGSAIGLKNIRNSDGSTRSIILVALRGGGYGKEWAGDFRVGSNNKAYHEGFGLAAADVEARLAFFINSNRQYISDDLRIWITGFSRAAATSNIVAADLIDGYMAGQGVEPNEVLAYCFECPQTVINANAHSQKYSNINNIVNPIDFVPKVPFKNWYFTRYGNTYYIPCKETTKSFEKKYKRQMIQKYQDLCEYNEILLTDDRVTEVTGQASALDGFFDHLSFWINRKNIIKTMKHRLWI